MSIYPIPAKLPDAANWLKFDLAKFSNSELLAFIISQNQEIKSSIALAQRVLKKIPAPCLVRASFEELVKAGLNSEQANNVLAAVEMTRRFCRQRLKNIYYSDEVIYQEFKYLRCCTQERLVVGYLDHRCHELRRKSFLFSQMRQPDFSPCEIFNPILKLPAQQLITASNHLSGGAEPNEVDLILFNKLLKICEAFGLEMLDNVIFSRCSFYSFRKAGRLKTSTG
ncbi:hypothetical protein KBI31_00705 [Patescibacteria group bacterium]|jgi:DNA repair protein RadC|nr:hypothetical protein [Patescibacteria group bacterium]